MVLGAITSLIDSEKEKHNGNLPSNRYSNVFEVANEYFVDALELFSKKHEIPLEKVCGGVLLMITGSFSRIETEATSWGYIVPKAKKIQLLQSAKLITLLDGEGTQDGSLGERTMQAIGSIPASGAIVLLDEATNGLSPEKSRIIRDKVLGVIGSQIIAASHNEGLIDGARYHPNWRVVKFPLSSR